MIFSYMWRAIQRQNFLFSQTQCQNSPLSHTVSLNHAVLKVEMCYPKTAARITLFSDKTKNLPVSIHHNAYLSKHSLFLFSSLLPSDILFLLSFFYVFLSLLPSFLISLFLFLPLSFTFSYSRCKKKEQSNGNILKSEIQEKFGDPNISRKFSS